jgi:hypothetical protein
MNHVGFYYYHHHRYCYHYYWWCCRCYFLHKHMQISAVRSYHTRAISLGTFQGNVLYCAYVEVYIILTAALRCTDDHRWRRDHSPVE